MRKIVAHIFFLKSELEPHTRLHIGELLKQWDKLAEGGRMVFRAMKVTDGSERAGGLGLIASHVRYNYLAFDVTGDLAFGSPFDKLKAARDAAPKTDAGLFRFNGRSPSVNSTEFRPWYRKGTVSTANPAGSAIAAVCKRLKSPPDRVDLLSKLQEGKDEDEKPMGRPELTAEALTQLIAGSGTTFKWDF
ncbi:hypothetical protein BJ322DRAFT_1111729 [Thelephora terrestris]|uniref:Uncharacterized protein n=1 Tax=Thelephora terrestris TaxID=56493 RepID=A0A9P6HBK9_9AGAM|nr:hypothetical protein BJ322DRAFT_1111729 [Thelephora terrestris]